MKRKKTADPKKYNAEYYAANRDKIAKKRREDPEAWKARNKRQNDATRNPLRALVLGYKMANPCPCGESHPACLDFDHRDDTDKKFSIGNGISKGVSLAAMKAEIAKCDIRCANCHRKRTAHQLNWYHATEILPCADEKNFGP